MPFHPFARLRQGMKTRADLLELSQLDTRLLRDMGIEPADIYDALQGRRVGLLLNPLRRRGQ